MRQSRCNNAWSEILIEFDEVINLKKYNEINSILQNFIYFSQKKKKQLNTNQDVCASLLLSNTGL